MSKEKIIAKYISEGESQKQLLGVEIEHFVCDADGHTVPYEAVCRILLQLMEKKGGEPYCEGDNLLGVQLAEYALSLEPAGQLEISISPQTEVKEIERIYKEFRLACEEILEKEGCHLVESGVLPLVENGEILPDALPLIPKNRYRLMNDYFETSGKYGKYMMRATASTQISIDYSSEADCMRKVRLLYKLSPLLALLMENQSGVKPKKEWLPHLYRIQIWNDLDKDRCGMPENCLSPDFSYEDYGKYICGKPLIVETETTEEKTLAEHMLSMFFFHIRLKRCIEIRIADSVPAERMLGYAALIKGILYHEAAFKKIEGLLEAVTDAGQITEAETAIIQEGYRARVYGRDVKEWLALLYETAEKALDEAELPYLQGVVTSPLATYMYVRHIPELMDEHARTAREEKEYILQSTAKYHERVVRTLYVPKIFTETQIREFEQLIKTICGIFDKVIAEYKRNEAFRSCFSFDKRLEELILLEPSYQCNIPMARIDIFYDEPTRRFRFCEFNTDGASAMNEDRELNHALKLTKAYKEFAAHFPVRSFELFDTWVEELLEIYKGSVQCRDRDKLPNIAIVDFLEHGTLNEFQIFKQRFENRGAVCEICDIRELKYQDGKCVTPTGMVADVIYRRAVTSDIMKHYDEVTEFLTCVKTGCVCVLGEFRTQIAHNKILFKVLHDKKFAYIFDESELRFIREHVPYTTSLTRQIFAENEALKESVYGDKDRWIVKPEDSYGSKGVLAGVECDEEKWVAFVESNLDQNYILQEFCTPYSTENIDLTVEEPADFAWRKTSNLTGLFTYNGKCKGIYSRVSFDEMISTQYNEMSLATIVI